MALMAWTGSDTALDAAARLLIERHHGRLDRQPGVAVFTGAAEALAAAVDWQQHPAATRALVVTVAELEPTSPTTAHALAAIKHLLDGAHHGDILATDVVRLLIADEITVMSEAADYQSVLDTVRASRPRLLITDVRMHPGQGDEGLRAASILRTEQPGLAVLVLSQHVQASAAADLLTGQTSGIGYLLKERVTALDEFIEAARSVAAGGTVIDPLITQELLARNRTVDHFQSWPTGSGRCWD